MSDKQLICPKCGKPVMGKRGLDHNRIAQILGATVYHLECRPAHSAAVKQAGLQARR